MRTWQLYVGPVVCSNTDGGSWGEAVSIRRWVCASADRNTEMGTNLISTVWTSKYKERNKFWCEQMFVKLNCWFQVAVFHVTLGYRVDVSPVASAAGSRDVSHFLERSEWVRRPPTYLVCIEGSSFESKAAVAWSSPLTCSQCWGIEWVELNLNCSIRSHDVHRHKICFSPHTTTVSTFERFDEGFPYRLMHTATYWQHFVTFLL